MINLQATFTELRKASVSALRVISQLESENIRLQSEVERLSGKTGFCAQCEKYARENEKLREALEFLMQTLKNDAIEGYDGKADLIYKSALGKDEK